MFEYGCNEVLTTNSEEKYLQTGFFKFRPLLRPALGNNSIENGAKNIYENDRKRMAKDIIFLGNNPGQPFLGLV